MKTLIAFLSLVVLLTLTSCGTKEVEITREIEVTQVVKETVVEQVEVTRIVKETVVQQVEGTPVFDAEAEEKLIRALLDETTTALAEADHETFISLLHKDFTQFETWPEFQYDVTRDDLVGVDLPPWEWHYDVIDVIVTPDMALVTARVTSRIEPGPELEVYDTLVLVKEDGRWQTRHGHVSFMP